MTTKPEPKPHKVRRGGNPKPSKHINPAVRPDDGRLAAVPTANFTVRLPVPLLATLRETAESQGATTTDVIRTALSARFERQQALHNVARIVMRDTEFRRGNGRGKSNSYTGDVDQIALAARQLAEMVMELIGELPPNEVDNGLPL